MRKSVGIITFHRAHNYGAMLQAFALQSALNQMGYDAHIIDYKSQVIEEQYKIFSFKLFKGKSIIHKLLYSGLRISLLHRIIRRRNAFNNFKNTYMHLKPFSLNKNDDDCLIFGSDQIWNNRLTGNDSVYWGCIKGKKKISYAASAGKIDLSFSKSYYHLSNFYALGVRETSLQQNLTSAGFKNVQLNLDPTLLLTKGQWITNLDLNNNKKDRYILVYSMRDRKNCIEMANYYSSMKGLKIIEMPSGVYSKSIFNSYLTKGPKDFVQLIANSEIVITDSFHGTAFSIIFEKPFISIRQPIGGNERIESLLGILNLTDSMVDYNYRGDFPIINFNDTRNILQKLRETSKGYLNNNI